MLAEDLSGKADRALGILEDGLDDALSVLALPEKYRTRLRTTNMLERLHQEIRRRERLIRIFPNDASAIRLIGTLLAEQHEVWSTERRYLDMEDYVEWKTKEEKRADGGQNQKSPTVITAVGDT